MILAIDIGATKTLVAYLSNDGNISHRTKFPTPKTYLSLVNQITNVLLENPQEFKIGVVAAPGHIDRKAGVATNFGNLNWTNATLKHDLEPIANCKIVVENDTKLAGLSEAIYIKDEFRNVLYVTISTGISGALIVDGVINPELQNSEGGHILIEHEGKLQSWESIASGKTIYAKYGKKASEIDDEKTWDDISYLFALGLFNLLAVIQPQVVVIGGGVGTHFKKYQKPLMKHLKAMASPIVPIPTIRGALHAEEAVIYGCYYLGKSKYADNNK